MEYSKKYLLELLRKAKIGMQTFFNNKKALFIGLLFFLVAIITPAFFQKSPTAISFVRVPSVINPAKDDIYTIRALATQIAPLQYLNWSDKTKKTISPETNILVYFDTNTPVTQQQIEDVEKFINNGGSAIFMVDGIYIPQGSKPVPASHNLFALFEKYGIKLHTNLLVSQTNAVANIITDKTSFSSAYPLWVKTSSFKKTNPAFESITSLTFPWSSSTSVVKSDRAKTEVLVASEKNSWIQQNEFNLAPNEIPVLSTSQQSTHNVIIQATTKSGGHLLVIPSARFVREQFLTIPAENVTFLGNILREYNSPKSSTKFKQIVQPMLVFVGIVIVLLAYYVFKLWRQKRAQH